MKSSPFKFKVKEAEAVGEIEKVNRGALAWAAVTKYHRPVA